MIGENQMTTGTVRCFPYTQGTGSTTTGETLDALTSVLEGGFVSRDLFAVNATTIDLV